MKFARLRGPGGAQAGALLPPSLFLRPRPVSPENPAAALVFAALLWYNNVSSCI